MKQVLKGRFSLICIVLGVALLLGTAGMLLSSSLLARQGSKDAAQILEKAQTLMPQAADRVPEERGNNKMASMEIDGVNVVGVLSFTGYGRTLPLAGDWDTTLVSSMPCRFTGSIYDTSLIIGAVDGETQLSFASRMEVGDEVVLTDMEGGRYTYQVEAIQHAKHATLEKLQAGDYALTIFVKDSNTSQYLLIRCQVSGW